MARTLAAAGAAVMVGDVLDDEGRAMAQSPTDSGATAGFVRLDARDEAQWVAADEATCSTLGGFDILINNAGIEETALVIEIDPEELLTMLDVNSVGTAQGLKHAFREMRPGGAAGPGGVVVNVASVAATIAFPATAGHSATMSAVDQLTRVAAMESGKLGYGVRVSFVCPGLVPTDMGMKLAGDVVAAGLFAQPRAPWARSWNRRRWGAWAR